MRNILKATTLENKFPLFTVENGCIVSKDADITVAFRVELPRTVHRHGSRIRSDTFRLEQGSQGAA